MPISEGGRAGFAIAAAELIEGLSTAGCGGQRRRIPRRFVGDEEPRSPSRARRASSFLGTRRSRRRIIRPMTTPTTAATANQAANPAAIHSGC
jgi:hypothetical protein